MMKVNFLKRLESSVHSFEITMERTIAKIEDLERKIRNYQALPNQNPESEELELNIAMPEVEGDPDDVTEVGGKFKYRLEHLHLEKWLKERRTCNFANTPRRIGWWPSDFQPLSEAMLVAHVNVLYSN